MKKMKVKDIKDVARVTKLLKNEVAGSYVVVYYDYTDGDLFAHLDQNTRLYNLMAKESRREADIINYPERKDHLVGKYCLLGPYTVDDLRLRLPRVFEKCEADWQEFEDTILKPARANRMNDIRLAREATGLSRAEVSRRLDIPIRTLEDYEFGKNKPSGWVERLLIEKLESMKNEKCQSAEIAD